MICNKCNHILPSDSEFCQYCGNRIEKMSTPRQMVENPGAPANLTNLSPAETIDEILKIQAKETIKIMEENSRTQPNLESDADFGLIPEKPIYTLALMSVDGEKEYLNKLYAANGQKIKYSRRCSLSVNGINGMIDVYDTFLPSGQPYKTLYINMYGAKKSTKAPLGFVFAPQKISTPKKDTETAKPTATKKSLLNKKFVIFTNILHIILTTVAILSIIVAMTAQDTKRNEYEQWNPTVVYSVLLWILGGFYVLACFSLIKNRFKLVSILSVIPFTAALIAIAEGSVTSYIYYASNVIRMFYKNYNAVEVLNGIWCTCAGLILVVALLTVIGLIVGKIINAWHSSITYREKCYKRVSAIHNHLEKGIISQKEYEETKKRILKNIE